MKFSRRNTTKRNAFDSILFCKLQAGAIAGGKLFLVFFCQPSADDRTDGVQHIVAGQIIGWCDFRLAGFFFVPLFLHQLRASCPKLNTRIGMNGIVDAAVARAETAEHLAVGGVDNGIAAKGGNITLP